MFVHMFTWTEFKMFKYACLLCLHAKQSQRWTGTLPFSKPIRQNSSQILSKTLGEIAVHHIWKNIFEELMVCYKICYEQKIGLNV